MRYFGSIIFLLYLSFSSCYNQENAKVQANLLVCDKDLSEYQLEAWPQQFWRTSTSEKHLLSGVHIQMDQIKQNDEWNIDDDYKSDLMSWLNHKDFIETTLRIHSITKEVKGMMARHQFQN